MLFRRKKHFVKDAKYQKDDYVNFKYKDELYFGYIYESYRDDNNEIYYTIQIAGQCPFFIYNYYEKDIIGIRKK